MIKFPNELTIAQVDEYLLEIQPIMDENTTIVIDDSNLIRIDTIGVQFILAVITYLLARKKEVEWQSTSNVLHESIQQLGIDEAILMDYLPNQS